MCVCFSFSVLVGKKNTLRGYSSDRKTRVYVWVRIQTMNTDPWISPSCDSLEPFYIAWPLEFLLRRRALP